MINPAKDSRSWHGEKRRQDREHKHNHRGKSGSGAGTRGMRRRAPRVAEQDPRRFATFDDDDEEENENNEFYVPKGSATKSLDELAEESLARSRSTRVTLEEEQEWARFTNMSNDDEEEEEDNALFDLDALQKAIESNTLSERLFVDDDDESEKKLVEDFENEGNEEKVVKETEVKKEEKIVEEVAVETTKANETKEEKIVEEEEEEEMNEEVEDDLIEDELDELLML